MTLAELERGNELQVLIADKDQNITDAQAIIDVIDPLTEAEFNAQYRGQLYLTPITPTLARMMVGLDTRADMLQTLNDVITASTASRDAYQAEFDAL